jgi:hypothetical protein
VFLLAEPGGGELFHGLVDCCFYGYLLLQKGFLSVGIGNNAFI